MKKKLNTEVDETTNTTNTDINLVFETPIAPLELDFNREDLNQLLAKVNEIIKKVN